MWEKDKQQRSNKRSETDWDVQTFSQTDGDGPVFSFGSLHLRCTYVSLTVFLRQGFVVASKNCSMLLKHEMHEYWLLTTACTVQCVWTRSLPLWTSRHYRSPCWQTMKECMWYNREIGFEGDLSYSEEFTYGKLTTMEPYAWLTADLTDTLRTSGNSLRQAWILVSGRCDEYMWNLERCSDVIFT